VGRLSKLHAREEAELAVLVDDRFQHLGIGTELYRRLIAIARTEQLKRLQCTVLVENREMQAICQKLGFRVSTDAEDGTVHAQLEL
jgi:acetyltransferase